MNRLAFLTFFVGVYSFSALAQEQSGVSWYLPEAEQTIGNRTLVVVAGKTKPGSRVEIKSDRIPLISAKNKIINFKSSAALKTEKVVIADSEGFFKFKFLLPRATAQIPIHVTEKGKQTAAYQLNVRVDKNDVKALTKDQLKLQPWKRGKFNLWAGVGFNFLRYSQVSADLQSDISFDTLKGPSYFLTGGMLIKPNWEMNLSYKVSPGGASAGPNVQVASGSYEWTILAIETWYFPSHWRAELLKNSLSQFGIRTGIQHHTVPFISRTGSSASEVDIAKNTMTMFTLGAQVDTKHTSKIFSEVYMRYQYPLKTGSLFSIEPQFAFDGSVGLIYRKGPVWRYGVFWYGQWHQYAFKHRDKVLNADIKGEQTLFYSNIEARLGYEFN